MCGVIGNYQRHKLHEIKTPPVACKLELILPTLCKNWIHILQTDPLQKKNLIIAAIAYKQLHLKYNIMGGTISYLP